MPERLGENVFTLGGTRLKNGDKYLQYSCKLQSQLSYLNYENDHEFDFTVKKKKNWENLFKAQTFWKDSHLTFYFLFICLIEYFSRCA